MLSISDKQYLLKTARIAIESAINDAVPATFNDCPSLLTKPCGAFVTLHEEGELRGCIGYTDAVRPLLQTVQEAAAKAATEDPRFTALTPDELAMIEIEISVLSPMKLVHNINEIEIGKHGLLIERKHSRGLLLPQVPVEYGWDVKTFLNQTARKAGLRSSSWNDSETKLFTFTAEIFSEQSVKPAAE